MNSRLMESIQDRADQHNQDRDLLDICSGTQVWLYSDRVTEEYDRKLAHIWHGPFREIDKCGDHAVRLEIVGRPYQVFPMIHVSKLKVVRQFPDRSMEQLRISEADRVDFDEDLFFKRHLGRRSGRRRARSGENNGHAIRTADTLWQGARTA